MASRIGRGDMYQGMAALLAKRSTCPRGRVGVVITNKEADRVLSLGYNGSPPGLPHCEDTSCTLEVVRERERCVRTVHAEVNAILRLSDTDRAIPKLMFCTDKPCFECMKVIASSGVEAVYYAHEYEDLLTDHLADLAGIHLIHAIRNPAGS